MKRNILIGLVLISLLLLPSGISIGRTDDPLLFTTHCYQEPVNQHQRSKSVGCVSDSKSAGICKSRKEK